MAALERALALAEPEGFCRTFLDEGPPLARLLYQAAARGIKVDYVGRLLASYEDAMRGAGRPAQPPPPGLSEAERMIEPLSDRELEIVQLIAEGLTNREIAARLFLSLNTVKVHNRNIYGKLNVHSRTQALARSRRLGILPLV
jgi:LuxR family maltose regulon positive regulatory protein